LAAGLPVQFERLESMVFANMKASPRDGLVLNPQFVEKMMGFPSSWTELEPAETL